MGHYRPVDKERIMPKVNGKKYPYTSSGKAAAKKARKRSSKKATRTKKRSY